MVCATVGSVCVSNSTPTSGRKYLAWIQACLTLATSWSSSNSEPVMRDELG